MNDIADLLNVASDIPWVKAQEAYDYTVTRGFGDCPWKAALRALGYGNNEFYMTYLAPAFSMYLDEVESGNFSIETAWYMLEEGMDKMPKEHVYAFERLWKRQAGLVDIQDEAMRPAEMVVSALLDAVGDTVEIEYHPTSIDTMPHTTWMLRAIGSSPTQYLAKGVAHTRAEAERQALEKVRLLGVRVQRVTDPQHSRPVQ